MSLFWSLFVVYFEKKADSASDDKESAAACSNAKVLGIVGMLMAAMFTLMQGFILYGAYTEALLGAEKWSVDIGKLSCILMGIVFIVLGNYMTKTRINAYVGVRISWSMYNDNTWRKSNRFGAVAIMMAGILTILTAVLMESSFGAAMVSLGYLCLATILTVIYAHRIYKSELPTA